MGDVLIVCIVPPAPFFCTHAWTYTMSDTEAGPHPNKEAVNSTHLKTVSFSSLLNGNESAASELLQAAVQDGFFYLDLHHAETQPLLDAVENLYKLNDNLFSLDQQSLMKYDLDVIGPSKIDGSVQLIDNL